MELLKQSLPEPMRGADVDEAPSGSWCMEWFGNSEHGTACLCVYLTPGGKIGYAYNTLKTMAHGEFDCILPALPPDIAAAVGAWQ